MSYVFTLFRTDTQPQAAECQENVSWDSILGSFAPENVFDSDWPKRELPLWSATKFTDNYRKSANVEAVYMLTLDIDEEPIPTADELRDHLSPFQAVVYSSSSATNDCPRWRGAIALSRPVTAEEYRRLWRMCTTGLPFKVGQAAKDPSRAWYVPRKGADGFYEMFDTKGDPLDVDVWLARAPLAEETKPAVGERVTAVAAPNLDKVRGAKLAGAAATLGAAWPAAGFKHQAQLALAGALYNARWAKEDALEFLCAVCRNAGNEERSKRRATIEHTWAKGDRGEAITGWTSLRSYVGEEPVDAARKLLERDEAKGLAEAYAAIGGTVQKTPPAPITAVAVPMPSVADPQPVQPSALEFEFGNWDTEPEPVEFLVEGLLPKGSISMWYGRADSLKTWLIFSMGIAMASGAPFLGTYRTKECRVGIVDYETGKSNVRRRLYMLRAGTNNKNLGTVAFTSLKPNQREFWVELMKWNFEVVFIDSLRRANGGADENDSGEAIIPLELAAEFSEITGCAVVFIHHAKKSASDGWPEFRGSAAIEDQVDCAFVVRKQDISTSSKMVEVKCTKPGDMPSPDPFTVEVEFNDSARTAIIRLGKPQTGEALPANDDNVPIEKIYQEIRLVLSSGPMTKNEIDNRVKGRRTTIFGAIDSLEEKGEITKLAAGFVLDDDKKREARVYEQIRQYDRWKTAAALAKPAFVPTAFVEGMIRRGLICERTTGGGVGGGFMIL